MLPDPLDRQLSSTTMTSAPGLIVKLLVLDVVPTAGANAPVLPREIVPLPPPLVMLASFKVPPESVVAPV